MGGLLQWLLLHVITNILNQNTSVLWVPSSVFMLCLVDILSCSVIDLWHFICIGTIRLTLRHHEIASAPVPGLQLRSICDGW